MAIKQFAVSLQRNNEKEPRKLKKSHQNNPTNFKTKTVTTKQNIFN